MSRNIKLLTRIHAGVLLVGMSAVTMNVGAADYPAPGDYQKGARVWADNCGRCHNIRGANDLRDDQWITTAFHMRIRGGLTGQETRDVLTFLQASNNSAGGASAVSFSSKSSGGSADGESVYKGTCIACHGADGAGALPGTPNFTRADGPLAKSDALLLKHITEGFQSPGSAMAMPPRGGNPNLGDAELKAVLAYLRKTFGQ